MSVSEGAKEVGDSSPILQRKECCTRTHVHINALIKDKITIAVLSEIESILFIKSSLPDE